MPTNTIQWLTVAMLFALAFLGIASAEETPATWALELRLSHESVALSDVVYWQVRLSNPTDREQELKEIFSPAFGDVKMWGRVADSGSEWSNVVLDKNAGRVSLGRSQNPRFKPGDTMDRFGFVFPAALEFAKRSDEIELRADFFRQNGTIVSEPVKLAVRPAVAPEQRWLDDADAFFRATTKHTKDRAYAQKLTRESNPSGVLRALELDSLHARLWESRGAKDEQHHQKQFVAHVVALSPIEREFWALEYGHCNVTAAESLFHRRPTVRQDVLFHIGICDALDKYFGDFTIDCQSPRTSAKAYRKYIDYYDRTEPGSIVDR